MHETLLPVSLRITQEMIDRYAVVADDFNPIHVDPEFAKASPLGGIIAHGTLSLNLIWQGLTKTFPKLLWQGVGVDVKFQRPARVGATLTLNGKRNDAGQYDIAIRDQDGTTLVAGTVTLPG